MKIGNRVGRDSIGQGWEVRRLWMQDVILLLEAGRLVSRSRRLHQSHIQRVESALCLAVVWLDESDDATQSVERLLGLSYVVGQRNSQFRRIRCCTKCPSLV